VARPARRFGLTAVIVTSFAVALAALLAILLVLVPSQANDYLTRTLADRGRAVAKEIERKVVISPREYDEVSSVEIDKIVGGETEIRYVWVLVCQEARCKNSELVASKPGTDSNVFASVLDQFNDRGRPLTMDLATRELLVADALKPQTGTGTGFVLVALDRSRIDDDLDNLRRTLLFWPLLVMIFFLIGMAFVSRFLISRPLGSMMTMASRLSEADLSSKVGGANTRELNSLSDALNLIGEGLRETLGRVRGVSEQVAQVIDQISRSASTSTSGAATVAQRVEETSSSMVEMLASLRGIAENVEVLYQSAEESSSSIMEMAATNDEVAENVTAMAASVEQTAGAIEQMTFSIKEVAKNIEDLLKAAGLTSSAMSEMDVAISQVETNAYETARLSEQVSRDSEQGVESLQKTMAGIRRIKESSGSASTVIEQLGRRIQEIGNIVDVIDDVAEQTNLLALNAAIIAAQAGEHGKGFAVVADEIKDLAERTGASTKEIADLIRSVQTEAVNAVTAMNQGVRSVDEGVELGKETEGALKKIQDSAHKSTQMVKAIARATVEQARGSKEVTGSIQRIAATVETISKATNQQALGSEQIMSSAERMKMLTTHVQRSVQEQAHGSKQITRSIENINEMVTHLNRAQKEQTRGSEQVLKAVETIKTVAEAQNRSVKQLEEAIETLRKQADVLRGEVRRFRV
jgi:methyl-accepting chemotaxis protein